MWLYLVQHGQAKTEEEDPERPLTDRGAADVRRVAEVAAAAGITTGRICHSGKTRARQTAEAWGQVLGAPVELTQALAPRDDPSVWAKQVATDTGDLMLVGHMPHLGRLAGVLLADDPQRPVVAFQPGALVGLQKSQAGWSVALVLPPNRLPTAGP
jgi:phosphohistidine phosphatase